MLKRVHIQIYAAVIWLILTSSLILWWMYFAVGLIDPTHTKSEQYKLMLISEGITLLLFLLIGGCTLVYFILKEKNRSAVLSQFFSAFSHDIKTSLASLRLQVESLYEDYPDLAPTLKRLLSDSSRLQLQVENSLYLGLQQKESSKKINFLMEPLKTQPLLNSLQSTWPQLQFQIQGSGIIYADRRAMDSILNNLAHNAIIHGRARTVWVEFKQEVISGESVLTLIFKDDGMGFKGPYDQLGQMHFRQNPSSGSGLGLYIVCSLVHEMKGRIEFKDNKGFTVFIQLKGRLDEPAFG